MEAGSKNRGTCATWTAGVSTALGAAAGGPRPESRGTALELTSTHTRTDGPNATTLKASLLQLYNVHRSLNILILYSAPFIASYWVSVLLLRSCTVSFGRSRVAGQHLLCL